MIKISPRALVTPRIGDAVVLDDPFPNAAPGASVLVHVAHIDGGFVFEFCFRGGDWVGENARAAKPLASVSAGWLAAAWDVAAEALRRRLGGSASDAMARCTECGRVISVPTGASGPVVEVLCGTSHVLTFASGMAAVVDAEGAVTWGNLAEV